MAKEFPTALSAQEKLSRVFDDKTHSMSTVDYSHHEVHEGDAFHLEVTDVAASTEYVELLVTPPVETVKEFHCIWSLTSTAAGSFSIIEGAGTISGGAAATPINQNRNSSNTTSSTQTLKGTVATGITYSGGTTIYGPRYFGAGQTQGAMSSRSGEFILKSGVATVFRITSAAAANRLWLEVQWYEHLDSNLQAVT